MIMLLVLLLTCLTCAEGCDCDSTTSCDTLCCCDNDCTEEIRVDIFKCQYNPVNDTVKSYCLPKTLFSKITPAKSGFTTVERGDDICFLSPSAPKSETEMKNPYVTNFDQVANNPKISFRSENDTYVSSQDTGGKVKYGDPVHQKKNGYYSAIFVPTAFYGQCASSPMIYLKNTTSSCKTVVTEDLCSTGTKLDALIAPLMMTVGYQKSTAVTAVVTCDGSSTCSIPFTHTYSGVLKCRKFAKDIAYTVTHDGANGIKSVTVKITTEDSQVIGETITISRSVTFVAESEKFTYSNEINNYRSHSPLTFNIGGSSSTYQPFKGSSCGPQASLNFPISSVYSCPVTIPDSDTTCNSVSNPLMAEIPIDLGLFENSVIGNASQWMVLKWTEGYDKSCDKVLKSINLLIHYRSTGQRIDPQNSITSVDVTFGYDSVTDLKRLGFMTKEKFMLYFTVTFINDDPIDQFVRSSLFDVVIDRFPVYDTPVVLLIIALVIFFVVSGIIVCFETSKPKFL